MANLTNTEANALLDSQGALFVQLHTANPTDTGTVAVSTAFPGRIAAGLGAAAARGRANTADVVSPAGAVAAETISHVSLWLAASGGVCAWYGPLTAPHAVALGEKFRLLAGQLVVNLT